MGTRVVRNITRKHDIRLLKQLRDFQNYYSIVREVTYLLDFANLETIDNDINPKYIIRDTVIIYMRTVCNIFKQRNLLETLVFVFLDENKIARKFEFSNNMLFNDDITILCFLYLLDSRPYRSETMQFLITLMKNKYGIEFEIDINNLLQDSELRKNSLTLYNVALSYPSIMYDMMSRLTSVDKSLCDEFSDIPKMFFYVSIYKVFPAKCEDRPLAMQLIMILLENDNIGTEFKSLYNCDLEKISLQMMISSILALYDLEFYPERLKIELCKKWKIVVKEGKIYKYAPCFAAYRQKAKMMIAEKRPNDPYLHRVLQMT